MSNDFALIHHESEGLYIISFASLEFHVTLCVAVDVAVVMATTSSQRTHKRTQKWFGSFNVLCVQERARARRRYTTMRTPIHGMREAASSISIARLTIIKSCMCSSIKAGTHFYEDTRKPDADDVYDDYKKGRPCGVAWKASAERVNDMRAVRLLAACFGVG